MGRTVMLVENLFNTRTFPSHTLTASSEATGQSVLFVGSGRRQRHLNVWSPSTTNADAYVQVDFDRVRSFDCIFLDRGHNLAGYAVSLRASSDAWSTFTEAASVTLPVVTTPGSPLAESPGVLTEEGAWGLRLSRTFHGTSFRFFVPAMGAGLKPEIVGIYVGRSWRLVHAQQWPTDHGKPELIYQEVISPEAWAAPGDVAKRDRGELNIQLDSFEEYALARYHIEQLFMARKPMWLVHDDDQAERSVLTYAPPGVAGFGFEAGWFPQQGRIPWVEHEPRLVV